MAVGTKSQSQTQSNPTFENDVEAVKAMRRVIRAFNVKASGRRAFRHRELQAALLDADRLTAWFDAKFKARKVGKEA